MVSLFVESNGAEESGEGKRSVRGAVAGGVLGWILVVLTIVAGDWRQLALAGALAFGGLAALGLFHRRALRNAKATGRTGYRAAMVAEPAVALSDTVDCWLSPGTGEERHLDLTDLEWAVIAPVLPADARGAEQRRIFNGVLWRLRTGAAWTEVPARYGSHKTCAASFNQWRKKGVWRRVLEAVHHIYDGEVELIDSATLVSAGRVPRRPQPVARKAASRRAPPAEAMQDQAQAQAA